MAISHLQASISIRKWAFWTVLAPQYFLLGKIKWVPDFIFVIEIE